MKLLSIEDCGDCGIGLRFGESYYAHDDIECFCWICKLRKAGVNIEAYYEERD